MTGLLTPLNTLEKDVKDDIIEYLDAINVWYEVTQAGVNVRRGIPDLKACVNGYFIACDFKQPKEKGVSKKRLRQIEELSLIAKQGGIAFFVDDVDFFKQVVTCCFNHDTKTLKALGYQQHLDGLNQCNILF